MPASTARRRTLAAAVLAALVAVPLTAPGAAEGAPAPQPPLKIEEFKYVPLGHFDPAKRSLPANASTACQTEAQPLRVGEVFNPSGTWNAFDNNVFEVLCLPFRGPGDTTTNDPLGNKGHPRHGSCGGAYSPDILGTYAAANGVCDNHQLEWNRYYAETMKTILKDFSPTVRTYKFNVAKPGTQVPPANTRYGTGINTAVVVPGADDADETVVIGAHYDKTNDAPAAAWDSQEGHAEMIRIAKLMADYWKATGTRPSATIKFIPWDGEESGTLGSQDYTANNIPEGEEHKVRGYWNTDPCAGGYPSYRYGNPADRLRMGIQLADPGQIAGVTAADAARITAFNSRAEPLVEAVLDHLDDTVSTTAGEQPVFLSKKEGNGDLGKAGGISLGTDRPVLFSSDWRNFETLGIPFFNPGPEVTGPQQDSSGNPDPNYGPDQSADALSTFHTPNDNIQTMFRFTQFDPTGLRYSDSWAKGMEFCAHMLGWGMLQHDQVGAQTLSNSVVAYYEALPNEATEDAPVHFNASGSYQYANAAAHTFVDESKLEFLWDFGDGTTGTGKEVDHAYQSSGRFLSKLTVRNKETGASNGMDVLITVLPNNVSPPVLDKPAASDDDGTFPLSFDYKGDRKELRGFSIEESRNARVALDERADSMNAWTASTDTPDTVAPWQPSDSPTPKRHGNISTSKPRSFWTGVPPADDQFSAGPSEGISMLTLKTPVQLPRGANASLVYQSSFTSDENDSGRVQMAIDNGDGRPLEWITVDTIVPGADDADSLSASEAQQNDMSGAVFKQRYVDVSQFSGRRVRMRFIYELGAPTAAPLPVARPGWYVDDIKLTAGVFREIGQTSAKTFTVAGRTRGTYAYRVKAVFNDQVKSTASNVETVDVTRGADGAAGTPGAGGTGRGAGPDAGACAKVAGFRSVVAKPTGRDVRFTLGLTGAPAKVELFRVSRGRTATKARRVGKAITTTKRTVTLKRTRLASGYYYARLITKARDGGRDIRTVTLRRSKGRFSVGKPFRRLRSCALLGAYSLGSPVFTAKRALEIRFSTTQNARVTVAVVRGKGKKAKTVKRFTRSTRSGRSTLVRLPAKGLRRGEYRIVATAKAGRTTSSSALYSRRL